MEYMYALDLISNSAAFFSRFNVLFAKARPLTIEEALNPARRICAELNDYRRGWFNKLGTLYEEVIDAEGGASHLLKSVK